MKKFKFGDKVKRIDVVPAEAIDEIIYEQGGIKMKLIEKIAESVHNAWWNEKKEQGFHSPKNCPYAIDSYVQGSFDKFKKICEKCHTDMYSYNELPENVKQYDRVTAKAVLESLKEEGLLNRGKIK